MKLNGSQEKKYFEEDDVVHCVKCGLEIKSNDDGTLAIDSANGISLATLIKAVAVM